jgi:hypothetical protein
MPATWPLTSERRTLPIRVRTAERTMRLRTRLRSLERMRFRAERELAKMTPLTNVGNWARPPNQRPGAWSIAIALRHSRVRRPESLFP